MNINNIIELCHIIIKMNINKNIGLSNIKIKKWILIYDLCHIIIKNEY